MSGRDKIANAYEKAQQWLAKANIALEKGQVDKARKYEAKAQYWLDRLNKLEGLS